MYFPDKVLDNAYFENIVDTTDEWIRTRTGIIERRILENGATSDLATKAAEDLFEKHNVNPEEIDVIIVATVTPDMFFPATACLVQIILEQKMLGDLIFLQLVQVFFLLITPVLCLIEIGQVQKSNGYWCR